MKCWYCHRDLYRKEIDYKRGLIFFYDEDDQSFREAHHHTPEKTGGRKLGKDPSERVKIQREHERLERAAASMLPPPSPEEKGKLEELMKGIEGLLFDSAWDAGSGIRREDDDDPYKDIP